MAVRNVNGKWISEPTEEEILSSLRRDLERLTPEEQQAFRVMLAEMRAGMEGGLVKAVEELEYEYKPVSPREFLENPYYLGEVGASIYGRLKEDFVRLFSGEYEEVIFTGGIGWGKSFMAHLTIIYVLYQLLCLRSPAESFGLAPGSPLHVVNLSARKDTAQRVVFEGIADKLMLSPFFKEMGVDRRKEEIRLPKGILVLGGESTDTSVLGLNVCAAVVDETNFMRNQISRKNMVRWAHFERAELLYSAIKTRMQSRFMRGGQLPGMLILVSSRQVPDDFTERRILQSRDDPKIFVLDYAVWDVRPNDYSKEKFKVFVGVGGQKPRILEEGEKVELKEGEKIVEVPVDFKRRFEENLPGSLRDLAGVSVVTVSTFLQNREAIIKAVDQRRGHPFSVEEWVAGGDGRFLWEKLVRRGASGEMEPIYFPHAIRYAHIDPSLSSDATGLAVGCVCGFRKVVRKDEEGKEYEEEAPVIWVDFLLRILPPRGGEIFMGDVRNLIYQMSEHGFPISKVTMDSWGGPEPIQQFRLKGYQSEVVSVDSTIQPYQLLKGTLYEGRISYYGYEPLLEELRQLELDWMRGKVDHPPSGRKDVADALCGVVWSLSQKYTKEGVKLLATPPMLGVSEEAKEDMYIPVDSRHPKAGQVLWPDEYDERLWGDREGDEEEWDEGESLPFIVG